jgi:hypothetical protein
MRESHASGFAADPCGKARPFRHNFLSLFARLRLAICRRRSLQSSFSDSTVRRSLTALCGGTAAKRTSVLPKFSWQHLAGRSALSIFFLSQILVATEPLAQAQKRNGAHSTSARDTFTASDRRLVERAIGATCAERIRDPLGSMPIDQMQSRPSLPVNNPDAVIGAQRAERLLPMTRKLVANAIIELAREYDLYDASVSRGRINAAIARVQAVRRVKPDVDARDNASVVLREPRTIEFGTLFLAGLRSDEAMISVLAHELTHIASGQTDSLRPLFRAIARRAAARTSLRIQGQRAEELACDLVGVIATRQFIKETPSWEPLPRRLARAFEHNCVDDDSSDEDHLSPRNTIRALFALDVSLAGELVTSPTIGRFAISPTLPMGTLTLSTADF